MHAADIHMAYVPYGHVRPLRRLGRPGYNQQSTHPLAEPLVSRPQSAPQIQISRSTRRRCPYHPVPRPHSPRLLFRLLSRALDICFSEPPWPVTLKNYLRPATVWIMVRVTVGAGHGRGRIRMRFLKARARTLFSSAFISAIFCRVIWALLILTSSGGLSESRVDPAGWRSSRGGNTLSPLNQASVFCDRARLQAGTKMSSLK